MKAKDLMPNSYEMGRIRLMNHFKRLMEEKERLESKLKPIRSEIRRLKKIGLILNKKRK